MPTPGERRALIFLASVAALGVAVRGWREFHPADSAPLAGNRTALARQIEAVDSAIAVTSSKRAPRVPRAPREASAPAAAPAPAGRRSRTVAPPDTAPRDPRQDYWDRSRHFDSLYVEADARDKSAKIQNHRDSKTTQSALSIRSRLAAEPPVDLDIVGLDEIAALPMVGDAVARRILNDRLENGPFGSIAELERVPGITHAFARRLEPFVTFSGSPRHAGAGEKRPPVKNGRRPGGQLRP